MQTDKEKQTYHKNWAEECWTWKMKWHKALIKCTGKSQTVFAFENSVFSNWLFIWKWFSEQYKR